MTNVTLSISSNDESRRCWWRRSISPKADVTTTAVLLDSATKATACCISELECRAGIQCCVDPVGMIDMNDAFRFAASCSSPKELITRLQFGTTDLWPEDVALPARWRYMADLIDSDRGMLVELDGALSTPVVDALVATAELCRQSATESVPAADWEYLRRALGWLERGSSGVDRALIAVGDELALIGLDGVEQDFSVATWLCMDVLDQFASGETIGYWMGRVKLWSSKMAEQQYNSGPIGREGSELTVAV
ncbi:hypothetical protein [Rhodococcus sp. IEGM 1330]|uniref:hypothetical protein n=1 Tax=Rhodococcus sp. IEGM 1330 TaxID=3082225 RepID=UPI002955DF61|nr:hypothetical protein [Rhodococcus sp. IEGM 1330]MDV8024360.1 hypothetical protein [Rhodococcus sp. IEGM 1330]